MFRVKWSEVSKQRIIEIAEHISLDAPIAADKWMDKILSKEDVLKGNPNIGRIVPEIGDEKTRELIVDGYRLIYEVENKEIVILTVINCREIKYFKN